MSSADITMPRRQALRHTLAAAALCCGVPSVSAQKSASPAKPLRVVQLLDTSADQQELSRDYSTGIRLALAELSGNGVRVPQLMSIEIDGSLASVERALRAVKDDVSTVAMLGSVGERVAMASIGLSKQVGLDIAHLAPWLADTRFDEDDQVFTLFASRDMQIQHALQSLAATGVTELGLIYPSPSVQQSMHPGIAAATGGSRLRLQAHTVPATGDIEGFVARLPSSLPAVLLFLGGTVELARFSQGLAQRGITRYVIGLADIDIAALLQLGPGKGVPLIFAQVVPNPQSSNLQVVRGYRDALRRYYDESPSPVSLAGYIAGRYAAQVMSRTSASATRASVLADLARRPGADLGGVSIDFSRNRRGSLFVNQIMLQGNGKLIG